MKGKQKFQNFLKKLKILKNYLKKINDIKFENMDEEQLKREVRQLLLVGPFLESFIKKYYSDKIVLSDMNILEKLKRGDLDKIKDKIRKPDLEDRKNPRPDWEFEGEKYSYLLELKSYEVDQFRYSDAEKNKEFISKKFGADSLETDQDLKLPLDMSDLGDSKILGPSKVYIKLFPAIDYNKTKLWRLENDKKFKRLALENIQSIIKSAELREELRKMPTFIQEMFIFAPDKVIIRFYYNKGIIKLYQEESGVYTLLPLEGNWVSSDEALHEIEKMVKDFVENAEKKFDHKEYEQHKKILAIFIDLFPLTLDVLKINFFDSLLDDIRNSKKNKIEHVDWSKNSEKIMPFPPSRILLLFSFR